MKRQIINKLIVIFIIISTIYYIGDNTIYSPFGLKTHAKQENIIVGYEPGYGIIDEPMIHGSEGYGYEYLSEIEKYSDYNFEYKAVSWEQGLEELKNGDIDLFGPASMTSERKEIYEYIDTAFCFETSNIYALDSNSYKGDTSDLNGKTFGTIKDSVYEDYFTKFANDHDIEYTLKYTDHKTAVTDMQNGVIDFYIDSLLYRRTGVKIIEELHSEDVYLMTTKGNTKLCNDLNSAIELIEAENPYWSGLLWDEYFGHIQNESDKITDQEKEALKTKDIYTVGYHVDWKPLSYKAEDGTPKGYAISTMNYLASLLNINIEYVPLHDGSTNTGSDVDFNLCMANIDCTSYGVFSEPYNYQNIMVLTDKGIKDYDSIKNIVLLDCSTNNFDEYLQKFTNAKIHYAYSDTEAQYLEKKYDADCRIGLETRMQMIINEEYNQSHGVNFLDEKVPLGITMSNELSKDIHNALNKVILSMPSSHVDEYIAQSINELTNITFWDVLRKNSTEIISIITIMLAFGIFIYVKVAIYNERKLKNIIEYDKLTGLMSSTKFSECLDSIIKQPNSKIYRVTSFDVDNFTSVVQTYGTKKSEELLCEIANSIKKHASKNTLLCRHHEYIFVIARPIDTVDELSDKPFFPQELTDTIIKKLGINIPIHFSVGIYILDESTLNSSEVKDSVKQAREKSKLQHGNYITVFDKKFKKRIEKETLIYNKMEQAIINKEFYIVIQPKIELETGKLIGGEVLVRWQTLDGNNIYPDEFISLFEKNGFITTLDTYVLEEACKFIKNSNVPLPRLSINVSPVTLLGTGFINNYMSVLKNYELTPSQFEIEITETALEVEFDQILFVTEQLRELGFTISIDDFGKGASSLSRIKELNVDIIKLDKWFINNNFDLEKGSLVISNVIDLATALGIKTLAEGIETKEQLEMLKDLGCDFGQGYFFAKPLPITEFLNKVKEESEKIYPKAINSKKKIKTYFTDFDNLPYAIVLVKNDVNYTIIDSNKVFLNMIGYTKEELKIKYNNSFDAILVDNLHLYVKEHIEQGNLNFEFDMRIRKQNGQILWVNNNASYDEKEGIFYIAIIDITNKINLSNDQLSLMATQAQKECMMHLLNSTSEYVMVSDIETGKLIYMNENAMRYLNFTKESDWQNKYYYELGFGSIEAIDESYNDELTEELSSREYYNSFHDAYLYVQNKLINVMDRKMRLNIVTDITLKKKIANETNLQTALKECIEYLYKTTTSNKITITQFPKMLERLRSYYSADRTYYFTLLRKKNIATNTYEVVREGVKAQGQKLQKVSINEIQTVLNRLKDGKSISFDVNTLVRTKENSNFIEMLNEGDINSIILSPILNDDGEVIGIIGVDNPQKNQNNIELLDLLNKYVWMFIKSVNTKILEKEALQTEEESKINLLEKRGTLLTSYENSHDNITEVLGLLRAHYGAEAATIISISEDEKTFDMIYENIREGDISKMYDVQNQPIVSFDRWKKIFSNGEPFVYKTIEDVSFDNKNLEMLKITGIKNVILSTLGNKNSKIKCILSVNNITIENRSKALVGVIAKDIYEYLEKISMHENHKQEVALDSLTGLTNKMSTQNTISDLLLNNETGVLMIIDIDHFKQINDHFGHTMGDIVLTDLAHEIKEICYNASVVGRIGGDEFMVFCKDPVTDDEIITMAKAVCKNCSKTYEKGNLTVETSTSIGILRITKNSYNFHEAYETVDKALYQAKEDGRDKFHFINSKLIK